MIPYQVIYNNINPIPYQVPLVASFFIAWFIGVIVQQIYKQYKQLSNQELSQTNPQFFLFVIVAMPLIFILFYGCTTFYNIFMLPNEIKNELVVEGKIQITSTELFDNPSSDKKWIKSFQIEGQNFVMFDITKDFWCFNNYSYRSNDYHDEELNSFISRLSKKQRFVRASYHYDNSEKCISRFEIQC
jgi:hypothetical protein